MLIENAGTSNLQISTTIFDDSYKVLVNNNEFYYDGGTSLNQLQKTLIIYAEKGKLILSPEIKSSIDELIADGIKHLGTFHIKKPLKKNKSGEVISENFYLLYFYHNRLTGYGLEKWIKPGRINI